MLEIFFSNVRTVVPPCNTTVSYTSGGTVYFITPPVISQYVARFVINTNTGYQPVNENYAPSSANAKQACSSNRSLFACELVELLMHSRKYHLAE